MNNVDVTKRVHIKVVSSQGHTDLDFDLDEALEYIQESATKEGKWLYLDNQFKSPKDITLEDLANSEDIILTNGLVGGAN